MISEIGAQRSEKAGWAEVSERKYVAETDWLFIKPVSSPFYTHIQTTFPSNLSLQSDVAVLSRISWQKGKESATCHIWDWLVKTCHSRISTALPFLASVIQISTMTLGAIAWKRQRHRKKGAGSLKLHLHESHPLVRTPMLDM